MLAARVRAVVAECRGAGGDARSRWGEPFVATCHWTAESVARRHQGSRQKTFDRGTRRHWAWAIRVV